jgi:hypothetical protein
MLGAGCDYFVLINVAWSDRYKKRTWVLAEGLLIWFSWETQAYQSGEIQFVRRLSM